MLHSPVQSLAQICLTSSDRFPPALAHLSLRKAVRGGLFLWGFSRLLELFSDAHALLLPLLLLLAKWRWRWRCRCRLPAIAGRLLLLAKVEAPAVDCFSPPVAHTTVWAKFSCLLPGFYFFCAAALAKTLSRGSYNFISCQLAAVSRRLLPLFSHIGREMCLCSYMYMFVYIYVRWLVLMRGVGLCLLGFCYSADSVFSLSAGVCASVCLPVCFGWLTKCGGYLGWG